MILVKRIGLVFGSAVIALLCAGSMGAQEQPEIPNAFGTDSYTVTTVSAMAFYPAFSSNAYSTSGSLGRFAATDVLRDFYTSLDLPAGAVIDYIGLNSTTDTNAVYGVGLWFRDSAGGKVLLAGFSAPAHGWATDLAGPLGIQVASNLGSELVLDVEQAPNPNYQFFAWVEVWWRRTVSPAPGTAAFNDVPTSHQFFQFIEALRASGITGGCGAGNYCPDNPVTRGQMAVFLAKALGLHWPN